MRATKSFIPSGSRVSIPYLNPCLQSLLHCVAIWPSNFLVNNNFGQYFGTRACIYTCTAPAGVYIHVHLHRSECNMEYIALAVSLIHPRSVIQLSIMEGLSQYIGIHSCKAFAHCSEFRVCCTGSICIVWLYVHLYNGKMSATWRYSICYWESPLREDSTVF